MHISEVPIGGQLTVIASKNKKSVELTTVAKQNFSGSLLVERITNARKQPISFAVNDLEITIIYVNKNRKPIIWQNTKIRHISIENENYHRIIQSSAGRETERRSSPRVFIGEDAIIRIGLSQKSINVRIKDLSYSGISFISEGNVNYEGSLLHITFKNGSGVLNVAASVVRKRPVKGKTSYVYGCTISTAQANPELDAYILRRRGER